MTILNPRKRRRFIAELVEPKTGEETSFHYQGEVSPTVRRQALRRTVIPGDKSGYELAMHMAGADIHACEDFGSYQGDWLALVTYDGVTGFAHGTYGSCSGCDSFEAEFDWDAREKSDYAERLAEFGAQYLSGLMTYEDTLAYAKQNTSWDLEAGEMVKWVENVWGRHHE